MSSEIENTVTEAPVAAVEEYTGPSTPSPLEIESLNFKEKMDYISLQIALLKPDEKNKFTSDFKVVGKSLNTLRKVLQHKDVPKEEWTINYKLIGCVSSLLLIFG